MKFSQRGQRLKLSSVVIRTPSDYQMVDDEEKRIVQFNTKLDEQGATLINTLTPNESEPLFILPPNTLTLDVGYVQDANASFICTRRVDLLAYFGVINQDIIFSEQRFGTGDPMQNTISGGVPFINNPNLQGFSIKAYLTNPIVTITGEITAFIRVLHEV